MGIRVHLAFAKYPNIYHQLSNNLDLLSSDSKWNLVFTVDIGHIITMMVAQTGMVWCGLLSNGLW